MNHCLAVSVQNVYKKYDENKILDNFSMSVEKGTIYGLLGASGCGKTTLLSCIIGLKNVDSGEIEVFGKTPGSKGSGVPGPRVGYMPQDVALVPEYTVKETIFFFGRIANMTDNDISKRYEELSTLFDLPSDNKFVTKCSGGQQRRISLAAAIVHQPQLLLLDEPTVGVDAVLRDKIWNYFLDLVRRQGISVIMTTHYIEECRNADKIGLMRNGKLLAEDSPDTILEFYQTSTLEQAFLRMCVEDSQGCVIGLKDNKSEADNHLVGSSTSMQSLERLNKSSEELIRNDIGKSKSFMGINSRKLHALLDKNFKQFYRNIFGIVLFAVLPITQMLFFLYFVGGDIKDLDLAIINDELSISECQHYDKNRTAIYNEETYECSFSNLSCRFLEYLDHPMIKKVYPVSLNRAKEGILHGDNVGVLHIPSNFSQAYQERVREIISLNESTLEMSQMTVYLDMSNRETGGALKYKLIELILEFQEDLYGNCTWNRRLGGKPVHEEYLYGQKDDSFTVFLVPGSLISISFFFAATMTSHIIVSEKCEGVWERSLAAGVTTVEIAVGHLILQLLLSIIQTTAPLLVCLFIYGIEYHGSVGDMMSTTFLQGICGLTFGFWISVESKNHTHAHILVTGMLFPSLIFCGMMWPIECLPYVLQVAAETLPFTLPLWALRNMIRKGWSFWNYKMIFCNLVPIAWTVFFIAISLLRIRKAS